MSLKRTPAHRTPSAAALLGLLGLGAGLTASHPALAAEGKRVALVVGVGEYANLPAELHLAKARADAQALSKVLQEDAGYEVMQLLDGFATKQAIESFIVESLPGMVGPQDTLLLYFEAHGMGADFGDPYILPYDAKPDDIEGSAMSISDLGVRIREAVDVTGLVLITDTAHAGEINGLALLGPNAKSWPDLAENTVILSASSPREPSPDGLFLPILVQALQGGADYSGDRTITASELQRYLVDKVPGASGDAVHPAEAGNYSPGLAICELPEPTEAPPPVADEPTPEPEPIARETREKTEGRHRRWGVAVPLLASAAVLEGLSIVFYAQGQGSADVVFHEADVPEGEDYGTYYSKYSKSHRLNLGLGIAAGVVAAAGGFFAIVPLQGGAAVGLQTRF